MVAEILLYSKLYHLLQRVDKFNRHAIGTEDGGELQHWREEWDYLFRTPLLHLFEFAETCVELDGHQYIEIGYYFAHLMLHAQALKLSDDGRATPVESPATRSTPSDVASHDSKKSHMSAISKLATQILNSAQRVEVSEIRVPFPSLPLDFPHPLSNSSILTFLACH